MNAAIASLANVVALQQLLHVGLNHDVRAECDNHRIGFYRVVHVRNRFFHRLPMEDELYRVDRGKKNSTHFCTNAGSNRPGVRIAWGEGPTCFGLAHWFDEQRCKFPISLCRRERLLECYLTSIIANVSAGVGHGPWYRQPRFHGVSFASEQVATLH